LCGRFARFSSLRTLETVFHIHATSADVIPSYNIAPTQQVLAVLYENGLKLEKLYWGLVPSWSKSLAAAPALINARAETLAAKPTFRSAFKRRRCLILADGFYEWKGEKGYKQPYYISLPSGRPFAFAGLWDIWEHKKTPPEEPPYKSCAIITREASESLRGIHHRMPVILEAGAHSSWLDPENQETNSLENILKNYHVREMKSYPVSKFVNQAKNNTPACIHPLSGK
jgi:putative SOS response-associated peptidase YedK